MTKKGKLAVLAVAVLALVFLRIAWVNVPTDPPRNVSVTTPTPELELLKATLAECEVMKKGFADEQALINILGDMPNMMVARLQVLVGDMRVAQVRGCTLEQLGISQEEWQVLLKRARMQ